MKKWLFLVVLFLVSEVGAYQFGTVYNPYTQKLDFYTLANFSGHNVTADYFCIGSSCVNSFSGAGDLTDVFAGFGINVTNPGGPSPTISINKSVLDSLYYGVGNPSGYISVDTNDTAVVNFHTSQIAGLYTNDSLRLLATDQRYNNTLLIQGVNTSANIAALGFYTSSQVSTIANNLQSNVSLKLDSTDQRYNNTGYVNTIANNLQSNISLKLDVTDQRYNNTILIQGVNTSANIAALGFYTSSQVSTIANNLQTNITNEASARSSFDSAIYTNVSGKLTATANTCGAGEYSAFNGTGFQCFVDAVGEPGTTDGNNYTTSISFGGNRLTLARSGMSSLTADIPNNAITISSVNITGQLSDGQIANASRWHGINTSANIAALGFYTTTQVNTIAINLQSNISTEVSARSTFDGNIYTNVSSLQAFRSAIYLNVTSINSTANIQSLGFNTTSQLDTRYYSITNPSGYISVDTNDTAALAIERARINSLNSTLLGVNTSANIAALGFYTSSQVSTIANNLQTNISSKLDATDQRYNNTAYVNTIANNLQSNISTKLTATAVSCSPGEYSRFNGTGFECFVDQEGEAGGGITTLVGRVGINVTSPTGPTATLDINRTYLDTIYYLASNPNGYISSDTNDTAALAVERARINSINATLLGVNTSANIAALGFYTSSQVSTIANNLQSNISLKLDATDQRYNNTAYVNTIANNLQTNISTESSARITFDGNIYTNVSSLQAFRGAIYTNVTAINTTANIQGLGFNTTAQLDNKYYSITNPSGYISSYVDTNDTAALAIERARINTVNATALAKASPGTCPDGSYVQNTTTGGVQCVALPAGVVDTNDTTTVNFHTSQIAGLYTNDTLRLLATDQRYNNTLLIQGVNTSANIAALGFYTNTQVNTISTNLQTNITNEASARSTFDGNIYTNVSSLQSFRNAIYLNVTSINTTANIQSLGFLTSSQISASYQTILPLESNQTINWTRLQNYPSACPAGTAVTQLDDAVTCTAFLQVDGTGGWTNTSAVTVTGLKVNLSAASPELFLSGDAGSGIGSIKFLEAQGPGGVALSYSSASNSLNITDNGDGVVIASFNRDTDSATIRNLSISTGCVYIPGGGRLCGNSTCSTLYSPNGATVMESCN